MGYTSTVNCRNIQIHTRLRKGVNLRIIMCWSEASPSHLGISKFLNQWVSAYVVSTSPLQLLLSQSQLLATDLFPKIGFSGTWHRCERGVLFTSLWMLEDFQMVLQSSTEILVLPAKTIKIIQTTLQDAFELISTTKRISSLLNLIIVCYHENTVCHKSPRIVC